MNEICDIKIGGTPSRDKPEYWEDGNNLWVSISELNNNIISDTNEKITDLGVQKSNVKLVKKDSILLIILLKIEQNFLNFLGKFLKFFSIRNFYHFFTGNISLVHSNTSFTKNK